MSSDGNVGRWFDVTRGGAYETSIGFERIEPTLSCSVRFTPTPRGTTNLMSSCDSTVTRAPSVPSSSAASPASYQRPSKWTRCESIPKFSPTIAIAVPPRVSAPALSRAAYTTAPAAFSSAVSYSASMRIDGAE